jgi:S1-C subfamily serine protease
VDSVIGAGQGAVDEDGAALDAYSNIVVSVARQLIPSVASLKIMQRVRGGRRMAGTGSAVAVTADGFMLTSAHVVEASSEGVAAFSDGREFDFEVIGRDPLSDLAVTRAAGGELSPCTLGGADDLQVGQLVLAIGNPLGFAGSVSAGVVSALGRSFPTRSGTSMRVVENVIQTDAALHPGNSGGALVDGRGRVVGISTAVVGPGIGQGLGLAVPINDVTRQIVASLMNEGRVRRAYLGIAGGPRPVPPRVAQALGRTQGVEVVQVVEGSAAERAGVRREDLILEVDGVPVEAGGDLQRLMTGERIGRRVTLRIWRHGDLIELSTIPAELPG